MTEAPRVSIQFIREPLQASQLDEAHTVIDSAYQRPDWGLDHTRGVLGGGTVLFIRDLATKELVGVGMHMFGSPQNLFRNPELTDETGCYLSFGAIVAERQGEGLASDYVREEIRDALQERSSLIFTRTQNPGVETTLRRVLGGLVEGGEIGSFAVERVLQRGVYRQELTPNNARVRNQEIQAEFDKLDASNGDAYILFFRLNQNPLKSE